MSYGLDIIKKNSLKAMGVSEEKLNTILESTDSGDIEGFAAQIGEMINELYKTSLAYEICDVQPLSTPTGSIFTMKKTQVSGNSYKAVVTKTPVETTNHPVDTGFTKEAWDDLASQFGKDANKVAASIFGAMSGGIESSSVIDVIKANAAALSNAANPDEMFQRVGEAIVKINQKTFHTLNAFVICPPKVAGYILVNPNHFLSDSLDTKSQNLMYKFGRTKFYVNPDATDNNVYIGVNSEEPGHSSLVFTPYQYTSSTTTNPDTGSTNVFLFNRYAVTLNPLHTTGYEMLYKFGLTY